MNPANIFQMMRGNPQQFIQQAMGNSQIMSNPMARNILNMAKNGNVQGIEQIGRNVAKEKGINFDKAFADFKKQFPNQF